MGSDIHLFVEMRIHNRWVSVDTWETDESWEPDDDEETHLKVPYAARYYNDRNYSLFAILANVRNARGSAGIRTGAGFKPIAVPRGLPPDVSPEVQAEARYWGRDGHSHSWLTLAELLAYDWDQVTTRQGWVDPLNYLFWKFEGRPRAWNAAVLGQAARRVSNEEMEEALTWGRPSAHLYTTVQWQETYRRCASDFLEQTLPRLRSLGPPDDVRIVFFFDN